MNLYTQTPTLKRFINTKIRKPKRQSSKKLTSGVQVAMFEFKNKTVIEVVIETKNVFNKPINSLF